MPDRPRQRRSPARYVAPFALVVVIAGVYLVVHTGLETGAADAPHARVHPRSPRSSRSHRGRAPRPTSSTTRAPASPATREIYVVRSGDTLDAIAARTGVSLRTLEALNPGVSSNALHVGQRLTVRR